MTTQTITSCWAMCRCCGRERRLARDRTVLASHNRWNPGAGAMVPCEGSGRLPDPHADGGELAGLAVPR